MDNTINTTMNASGADTSHASGKRRKLGELDDTQEVIIIDEMEDVNKPSNKAPKVLAIEAFLEGSKTLHAAACDNSTVTEASKRYVESLIRWNERNQKLARFDDPSFTPHAVRLNCELKGSKQVIEGEKFKDLAKKFNEARDTFIQDARALMKAEQILEQRHLEESIITQITSFARTLIEDDLLEREYAENSTEIDQQIVSSLLAHSMTRYKDKYWAPLLLGHNTHTLTQSLDPKPHILLETVAGEKKGVSIRVAFQIHSTFGMALATYNKATKDIAKYELMKRNRETKKVDKLTEEVVMKTDELHNALDADTIRALVRETMQSVSQERHQRGNNPAGNTKQKQKRVAFTSSTSTTTNTSNRRIIQKNNNNNGNGNDKDKNRRNDRRNNNRNNTGTDQDNNNARHDHRSNTRKNNNNSRKNSHSVKGRSVDDNNGDTRNGNRKNTSKNQRNSGRK